MELRVNIRKKLRDFTLAVDFSTADEVFALLGASGCGKSMTLKCIAGLETPDSGFISLNGRTLYDSGSNVNLPPQRRRIGYLFQNYALFPNMTVAENIYFVAVGEKEERWRKTRENLARFSLAELAEAYPARLSGGQQQRVALARILAADAELLMLDEPFAALDDYLKWQLELELAEVLKAYRGAALLVSHDRGEAYRLAARIAVMRRGRIDTISGKQELFANPQTMSAALLTGCKNLSTARFLDEHTLYAVEWQLKLKCADLVPQDLKYVGLRRHYCRYAPQGGENCFPMEVIKVIEDISFCLIMVRLKGTGAAPICWELPKGDWREIKAGELCLSFSPDSLILMRQ